MLDHPEYTVWCPPTSILGSLLAKVCYLIRKDTLAILSYRGKTLAHDLLLSFFKPQTLALKLRQLADRTNPVGLLCTCVGMRHC